MEETDMAEKINKYEAIAPQILELVGGKDNIRSCTLHDPAALQREG